MTILAPLSNARDHTVYFGTSGNEGTGIYATNFDSQNGRLTKPVELAARIDSPGWITPHPELPILYSSGIDPESRKTVVAAWEFDAEANDYSLKTMGQLPTGCGHVTHLMVHPSGRLLATAHYGDSSIAIFSLDSDGKILKRTQLVELTDFTPVIPDRQDKAHPHYATFDPSGKFLLVPDLGADTVYVYKVNLELKSLSLHDKVSSQPGTGPRHMKFSNDGHMSFVLNELSLTVDTCTWDAQSGTLKHTSSVAALPVDMLEAEVENTGSEIRVHPNGRFVYTGNRGNDSISVFRMDSVTGALERLQIIPARAAWPRNFNFDPTGQWIICGGQDSSNAGVFSINQDTGILTYVPHSSILVPSPICVHFIDE